MPHPPAPRLHTKGEGQSMPLPARQERGKSEGAEEEEGSLKFSTIWMRASECFLSCIRTREEAKCAVMRGLRRLVVIMAACGEGEEGDSPKGNYKT